MDFGQRQVHLALQQQRQRGQAFVDALHNRFALLGRRFAQYPVDDLGAHARVADTDAVSHLFTFMFMRKSQITSICSGSVIKWFSKSWSLVPTVTFFAMSP